MTKIQIKKEIFLLIGIFWCVILGSIVVKSVAIDSSIVLKGVAIDNYDLGLNITWDSSDVDFGYGLALDDSGNIYITGITTSWITPITDYPTYPYDVVRSNAFIAKYDSTGNSLLNITWNNSVYDAGYGIALDNSGNIYITGLTYSFSTDINNFNCNAFIAKYDSTGNSLLNITWDGSVYDAGYDLALDNSGNIYITGITYGFSKDDSNAFIAKYDSTGNSLLNITWGGSYSDYGDSLALDDDGNIYITGQTRSFRSGTYDAFIAKYDSTGNSLLNITRGGNDYYSGYGIALDDSGNIYFTGETNSVSTGRENSFIAKYDSTGNSLLNITWDGSCGSYMKHGDSLALDDDGNIYITASRSYDAFIAKYDSTGNSLLNITWGGSNHYSEKGIAIAIDNCRNIYITGFTRSSDSWGRSNAFIVKYVRNVGILRISGYNLYILFGFLGIFFLILTFKISKLENQKSPNTQM